MKAKLIILAMFLMLLIPVVVMAADDQVVLSIQGMTCQL